jgi:hypothetical protein
MISKLRKRKATEASLSHSSINTKAACGSLFHPAYDLASRKSTFASLHCVRRLTLWPSGAKPLKAPTAGGVKLSSLQKGVVGMCALHQRSRC